MALAFGLHTLVWLAITMATRDHIWLAMLLIVGSSRVAGSRAAAVRVAAQGIWRRSIVPQTLRLKGVQRGFRVSLSRYRDGVLPTPTPRLRFRAMTEGDLADIATLEISASRGAKGWIEWNRRNYTEHGFGLWVIETHAGEFVGDCGLTMQEVEDEWHVEAGWHVRSALRRQGYAAEAAAAVRVAAQESGVEHLIAIIRPDNIASQRVATKIGLVLEREVHKHGGPALVFGTDLKASQLEQ